MIFPDNAVATSNALTWPSRLIIPLLGNWAGGLAATLFPSVAGGGALGAAAGLAGALGAGLAGVGAGSPLFCTTETVGVAEGVELPEPDDGDAEETGL